MSAPTIQANYEQLSQIAATFDENADLINQQLRYVMQQIDQCRQGNWEGSHADAFYVRMDNEVLPGVERLFRALGEANDVTNQIIRIFEAAEEDAQACFTYGEGGGSSAGGGGVGGAAGGGAVGAGVSAAASRGNLPQSLNGINGPVDRPSWFTQTTTQDGGFTGAANADVLYVNGIMTDPAGNMDGVMKTSEMVGGRPVTGLYNQTDGFLTDIGQSGGDLMDASWGMRPGENQAVVSMMDWIRNNPDGEIFAHSQGGAITAAALQRLHEQGFDISGLEVKTFGGAGFDFPPGPDYDHYLHAQDPIPMGIRGTLDPGSLITHTFNDDITILPDDALNPMDSHYYQSYAENYSEFLQAEQQGEIGYHFNNAVDTIGQGVNDFTDWAGDQVDSATDWAGDRVDDVKNFFSNPPDLNPFN
jgi:WXG100 family type VII secretion target